MFNKLTSPNKELGVRIEVEADREGVLGRTEANGGTK